MICALIEACNEIHVLHISALFLSDPDLVFMLINAGSTMDHVCAYCLWSSLSDIGLNIVTDYVILLAFLDVILIAYTLNTCIPLLF